MAFDEQAARDFLEGGATFDKSAAEAFLKGEPEPVKEEEPELEPKYKGLTKLLVDEDSPEIIHDTMRAIGEFGGAGNQYLLDLMGLPGDAADWVAEKMGSSFRTGGSRVLREAGEDIGITQADLPDTPFTRAGTYTAAGLTFLAPFLQYGKGALEAVKAGQATQAGVSTTKAVAQRVTAPFITAPKSAILSELVSSGGAGVGAYYGEKYYGQTGELFGGLMGGLAGMPTAIASPWVARQFKKTFGAASKAGARIKASDRLHQLAETEGLDKAVTQRQQKILPGAKVTPGKLAGDRHIIALEKEILKADYALEHQFLLNEVKTNNLVRQELSSLGGDVPVAKTQAYLRGKIEHMTNLVNFKVDQSLKKSADMLARVSPRLARSEANRVVYKQIDDALVKARGVESDAWAKVNPKSRVGTNNARMILESELQKRAETADPADIPEFVYKAFGRLDKQNTLTTGKLGTLTNVNEMKTMRSRINNMARAEKAKDAPNWNRVRVWDDIQSAILKDMEDAPDASSYAEAIAVSRHLNEKFKGGIMDVIFGHEKTGGRVAPEISLEALRGGPKTAVEIKRILNASPESKDIIEDYLKLGFARKGTRNGRVMTDPAKRWVTENEDTLQIYPELKKQIDNAIGAEERVIGLSKSGKARVKRIEGTQAAKITKTKPGRVMSEVLTSASPEKAMRKAVQRSNTIGKAGIKNDIVDFLWGKSKAGTDDLGGDILSGRKFKNAWEKNKHIFRHGLNSDDMKRLDTLMETLVVNEGFRDLPDVGGIISPQQGVIAYGLVTLATRAGAKLGHGASGASLRTATTASRMAQKTLDMFDVGKAQKVLRDSIQDPELFKAVYSDTQRPLDLNKSLKVLNGWLLAHTAESLEEK